MCTASLVIGILSLIVSNLSFIPGMHFLSYLGIAAGIAGIVLGLVSLRQCRRNESHAGRSTWGIVLSVISLVISVAGTIINRSY